jgi:hypothetical protein
MHQRRQRLQERFLQQQRFAAESSPLTSCLCGVVAQWLDHSSGEDVLASWLVESSLACSSMAVPMLLMAALHRAILEGDPASSSLGEFFPSVGGRRPVEADALRPLLRQVVLVCRDRLSRAFTASAVQTNETGRGLCWLLPVLYTGWPAMHLVDLGCSAGLNLVADQRHYQLCGTGPDGQDMSIGMGVGEQFVIPCSGDFVAPQQTAVPQILSRQGCDRQPLFLKTEADEQHLASYVWGDQVERLLMLRQGIKALHRAEYSPAPVQLVAADLPNGLDTLLDALLQTNTAPVVVYNTYLTSYLPCKGKGLEAQLDQWAGRQSVPVLWLQWEPLRHHLSPPALGWLGWTADLWMQGERRRWHLAWVHPHGAGIQWLPDLAELGTVFSNRQKS